MAIGTNARIDVFGDKVYVNNGGAISLTQAIASGQLSLASDIVTWINIDNVDGAAVTLSGNFAVAPNARSNIALLARKKNVTGITHDSEPTTTFGHTMLGAFPVKNIIGAQTITIDIYLPNYKPSSEYDFYLQNNGGQDFSGNWTLEVGPKTDGANP